MFTPVVSYIPKLAPEKFMAFTMPHICSAQCYTLVQLDLFEDVPCIPPKGWPKLFDTKAYSMFQSNDL